MSDDEIGGLETSLAFAKMEGNEWGQIPFHDWVEFNNYSGSRQPLHGLRGRVHFVLFVVSEGYACNAIPHHLFLDDVGNYIEDLSLSADDRNRMNTLWSSNKKSDQVEYNRIGEKGYRNALPDMESIRQLLRILPVPIDSNGGINSFLALAGLDPGNFVRQNRTSFN